MLLSICIICDKSFRELQSHVQVQMLHKQAPFNVFINIFIWGFYLFAFVQKKTSKDLLNE